MQENHDEETRKNVEKLYGNRIRLRVCALCRLDNKLLVIKHAGLGSDYLLAPPGGGVELFETTEAALARELREEAGIRLLEANFLFFSEIVKPPLHAVELFFEVRFEGIIRKGHDPESDLQIIREIEFVEYEDILKEKPENRHSIFSRFKSLDDMMSGKEK